MNRKTNMGAEKALNTITFALVEADLVKNDLLSENLHDIELEGEKYTAKEALQKAINLLSKVQDEIVIAKHYPQKFEIKDIEKEEDENDKYCMVIIAGAYNGDAQILMDGSAQAVARGLLVANAQFKEQYKEEIENQNKLSKEEYC